MSELEKSHEARLRITFDTNAEAQQEREIEIMTAEVSRMFNFSALKVKKLVDQADRNAPDAEMRIRKNVQRGLATRLHELSQQFKTMQKAYMARLKTVQANTSIDTFAGIRPTSTYRAF